MSDVAHLLAILDRLVDGGNTVIVIEHKMDVVRRAHWIIDLGPEGGSKGASCSKGRRRRCSRRLNR